MWPSDTAWSFHPPITCPTPRATSEGGTAALTLRYSALHAGAANSLGILSCTRKSLLTQEGLQKAPGIAKFLGEVWGKASVKASGGTACSGATMGGTAQHPPHR